MEELVKSDMKTPIEIALGVDENGTTTARALYDFLELAQGQFSRWAKANIESNEFYEENKDWWGFDIVSNGNNCKDYRLTTDFAKHLSMESHSARGKEARRYFIAIEDRAKQEVINRSQLSPQMQMVMSMAEGMARQELEQKRQAKRLRSGENFPSDQTLALICKEFNVNEDWLINGIGNVYKEKDGTFTELLSEIDDSDDDFIKSLITVYMGLDEDSKKALRKIAKGMSEKYKKQD